MAWRRSLADGYSERAAGDVIWTPPYCERVVALLVGLVRDGVRAGFHPLVGQLRHRVACRRYHSQRQQRLSCKPCHLFNHSRNVQSRVGTWPMVP